MNQKQFDEILTEIKEVFMKNEIFDLATIVGLLEITKQNALTSSINPIEFLKGIKEGIQNGR